MSLKPASAVGMGMVLLLLAGCASEARTVAVRPAVVERPVPAAGSGIETYAGEVRARHESRLGFRIDGKLLSRPVDAGTRVRRGEVLATLEATDLLVQVDAARAALAAAEADEALARAELDRHAELLSRRYISQALYDARANAHQAAQARRVQARSQLAVAENQAAYTALRADADGVITAVLAEAGQVVAAGAPVVGLAHDGEREVLIAVPEQRIASFRPGLPVQVEVWARDGARFPGVVREVAPEADPRTRTYDLRVALDDAQAPVKLGMTARVLLAASGGTDVLLLPLSALHEKDGQPAVWVLDPTTREVALRPVDVAGFREEGLALRAGIGARDWVVTAGVHTLVEGQPVRPIDRANRPLDP
ncbi:MAG: efflux RND transporter periplasmic adaptor subunit [Pseudomonadota bacterium]